MCRGPNSELGRVSNIEYFTLCPIGNEWLKRFEIEP